MLKLKSFPKKFKRSICSKCFEKYAFSLDTLFVLVLIIFSVIVTFNTFEGFDKLISYSDFSFPLYPERELLRNMYTYRERDLGQASPQSFFSQIYVIATYFFKLITGSLSASEILCFILLLSLTSVCFYILASFILRSQKDMVVKKAASVSAFLGALIYTYNPYVLTNKIGTGYVISLYSYALVPLFIMLATNALVSQNGAFHIIVLTLIFTIVAHIAGSNPLHLFPFLIGFVYALLLCKVFKQRFNSKIYARLFCFLVLILLSNTDLILINSAMFYDVITLKSLQSAPRVLVGSESFVESFVGLGIWGLKASYKGEPYAPFVATYYYNPILIIIQFSLVALAYVCLILCPNNLKNIITQTTFLCLVFQFLSKGSVAPFGEINEFIHNNIPFMWMFAQTYDKFGGIYWLFLSILFSSSIFLIMIRLNLSATRRFMYVFLLYLLIAIVLISIPFLQGEMVPRHNKILKNNRFTLPDEYGYAVNLLSNDTTIYRILGLPMINSPQSGWIPYKWDYVGGDPFYHYFDYYLTLNQYKGTLYNYEIFKTLSEISRNNSYNSNILLKLYTITNIKYIIVRTDVDSDFYDGSQKPEEAMKIINAIQEIKPMDTNCGLLRIYVLNDSARLPHVYATKHFMLVENMKDLVSSLNNSNSMELVYFIASELEPGKISFLKRLQQYGRMNIALTNYSLCNPVLTFKKVNPTKYLISVENATGPFFLLFLESFTPWWKVYVKSYPTAFGQTIAEYPDVGVTEVKHDYWQFTTGDITLLFQNPSVNESLHFIANGYANAWYINPKEVDTDGDGRFTITIFFLPQAFFYLGLIISGSTVICCIAYLICVVKVKAHEFSSLFRILRYFVNR